LLGCPLIGLYPYLSLTRLNLHCGLINTFWPKQPLVLLSRTGVSCKPLVVTLTSTCSSFSRLYV
ncbi:unnamed protein product, partial [Hymenolepis diminuta]